MKGDILLELESQLWCFRPATLAPGWGWPSWSEAERRALSTGLSEPANGEQAQHHVLLLLHWEQEERLYLLPASSLQSLIRDYGLVCLQV